MAKPQPCGCEKNGGQRMRMWIDCTAARLNHSHSPEQTGNQDGESIGHGLERHLVHKLDIIGDHSSSQVVAQLLSGFKNLIKARIIVFCNNLHKRSSGDTAQGRCCQFELRHF